MGFATDAARSSEASVWYRTLDAPHLHTELDQGELHIIHQQNGQQRRIGEEHPLHDFIQAHPQDWPQRLDTLTEQANDQLDLGKHLAYRAITQENPETLQRARNILDGAAQNFGYAVADPVIAEEELNAFRPPGEQWNGPRSDPQAAAQSTMAYVTRMAGQNNWGDGYPQDEAARSLTKRTAHRETGNIMNETLSIIRVSGESENNSALQDLCQTAFAEAQPGLQVSLETRDQDLVTQSYREMGQLQEKLAALAHNPQPAGEFPAGQNVNNELLQFIRESLEQLPPEREGLQAIAARESHRLLRDAEARADNILENDTPASQLQHTMVIRETRKAATFARIAVGE